MTRAQIAVTAQDREGYVTTISETLKVVLVVAGWPNEKPITEVGFSFVDAISTIVDLSLRINTTIGEEITSMDIQPINVYPQTRYNPVTMDDVFTHKKKVDKTTTCIDRVAATTDMGLQTVWMERNAGIGGRIFLKPKVVLESVFEKRAG